jgi:hypothetical protein
MRINSYIRIALSGLTLFCSLSSPALAQTGQSSKPTMADGSNNESAKANLDWVAQSAGEDKLIIVIARLGLKESKTRVSRQRLETVRMYLENTRAVPRERIITAEGRRVRGFGQAEIYLDGKLFMVFTFARNRNFAPQG